MHVKAPYLDLHLGFDATNTADLTKLQTILGIIRNEIPCEAQAGALTSAGHRWEELHREYANKAAAQFYAEFPEADPMPKGAK